MKTPVPMRARTSKRSWVPWTDRPSRRRAVARLHRRSGDGRYYVSIALFVFMTSALVISMAGGVITTASAERRNWDNRSNEWAYYQRNSRENPQNNRGTQNRGNENQRQEKPTPPPVQETRRSEPKPQTNEEAQTPVAAAQKPTPPVAPAATTSQPVQSAQATAATATKPADTAPAIKKMAAAQADKPTTPVTYTSQQISEDTRNQLLMVAGSAMAVSVIMYALTMVGGGPKVASAPSMGTPRYIPIKEVVTN